jgi:hypothetical protein
MFYSGFCSAFYRENTPPLGSAFIFLHFLFLISFPAPQITFPPLSHFVYPAHGCAKCFFVSFTFPFASPCTLFVSSVARMRGHILQHDILPPYLNFLSISHGNFSPFPSINHPLLKTIHFSRDRPLGAVPRTAFRHSPPTEPGDVTNLLLQDCYRRSVQGT